ncbi:hypothetical protein EDC04DRAFT_2717675, partial [Pisolithus marmoratus]
MIESLLSLIIVRISVIATRPLDICMGGGSTNCTIIQAFGQILLKDFTSHVLEPNSLRRRAMKIAFLGHGALGTRCNSW